MGRDFDSTREYTGVTELNRTEQSRNQIKVEVHDDIIAETLSTVWAILSKTTNLHKEVSIATMVTRLVQRNRVLYTPTISLHYSTV